MVIVLRSADAIAVGLGTLGSLSISRQTDRLVLLLRSWGIAARKLVYRGSVSSLRLVGSRKGWSTCAGSALSPRIGIGRLGILASRIPHMRAPYGHSLVWLRCFL